MAATSTSPAPHRPSGQEGAMAVEFSIIFLILFFLVFVLLNIGLIFAAQQSLNIAAQESVRSLLRFYPPGSLSYVQLQQAKLNRALEIAKAQTHWISQLADTINTDESPKVNITLCNAKGVLTSAGIASSCSFAQPLHPHEVAVSIHYDYGLAPLVPDLGLIGIYTFAFSDLVLTNTQRISTSERWEALP